MGTSDTGTRLSVSALIEKTIDGIRQNLFWTAIGLVIIALAAAYVLVVSPIRNEINSTRGNVDTRYKTLLKLSTADDLANDAMTALAKTEEQKLHALYGSASLIMSNRCNFFYDVPFVQSNPDEAHRKKWADDFYLPARDRLTELAKKEFNAPDQAVYLEPIPPGPAPKLEIILALQKQYWATHYILSVLQTLNAEQGAQPPVIEQLNAIRIGAGQFPPVHQHPWVQPLPVKLSVTIPPEKLGQLIARLQNGPVLFAAHTTKINQPGFAVAAGSAAAFPLPNPRDIKPPSVNVEISGDMLEPRIVIQSIALTGFENAPKAGEWITQQQQLLDNTLAFAAAKIPRLKTQLDLLALQRLDLQNETAAASAIPGGSASFELLDNFLYPLAPNGAYLLGSTKDDPAILLARASNGNWCFADYTLRRPANPPAEADPQTFLIAGNADTQIAILSDSSGPAQILISESGKDWQACPIIKTDRRPLIISEAAFLFPAAFRTAAANVRSGNPLSTDLKMTFFPDNILENKKGEYQVKISEPPDGALTVTTNYRK